MSIRLNFCRSAPPEFLQSFLHLLRFCYGDSLFVAFVCLLRELYWWYCRNLEQLLWCWAEIEKEHCYSDIVMKSTTCTNPYQILHSTWQISRCNLNNTLHWALFLMIICLKAEKVCLVLKDRLISSFFINKARKERPTLCHRSRIDPQKFPQGIFWLAALYKWIYAPLKYPLSSFGRIGNHHGGKLTPYSKPNVTGPQRKWIILGQLLFLNH